MAFCFPAIVVWKKQVKAVLLGKDEEQNIILIYSPVFTIFSPDSGRWNTKCFVFKLIS